MPNYDTGVFALPAVRPSTFSPIQAGVTIPAPVLATDYGVATQPVSRPNTFDATAAAVITTVADPGDVLSG